MSGSGRFTEPKIGAEWAIPQVSIHLLGRFVVRRDGHELPDRVFGGRLARHLLRMLAASRGALLSKDVAIEALWPTHPPADAPGNVEILISRIRHALGDRSLIPVGSGGYTLVGDDRCWVDVEAFLTAVGHGQATASHDPAAALAAFRDALSLWHGDPLPEDAYADWATEHRHLLFRAHLDALEGAATAALALGNPTAAVTWAQAAVEEYPLRETATMLLVHALAAGGDCAEALTTFDAFGRRLADELGVDPSPDALQLRQDVLCGHGRTPRAVTARAWPLIASRVGALSGPARDVLTLTALTGSRSATSVLGTAAGLDLRATLDALGELRQAGLVEGTEEGWTVATDAVGDIALADLDRGDRLRGHLMLAQSLREHGADPADVADHLAAGGDRPEAVAAFAQAAGMRLNCLADGEALRLAEAGLAIAPPGTTRATLLQARGEARRRMGYLRDARIDLDLACAETGAGPERSRILARRAILEARSRDATRGAQLAELAVAEAGDDPAARGQALAAGALVDLWLARLDRATRCVQRARRFLHEAGDPDGTARLLHWHGMASFVAGRLTEAITVLDSLAGLPSTPSETLRLWNPRATRGHALVLLGQPTAGLAEIDTALARALAIDHPVMHSSCLWHRSEALTALGRHAEAVEAAEAALAIARRVGHAEWTTASLRGLGVAWQAAGDLGRAEAAFRDALHAGRAIPLFAGWASARLGLVLVGQGRLADAEQFIDTALSEGAPLTRHEARWARAELLHTRGDPTAPAAAGAALAAARADRYQALVPRLAVLAG
jgi:DNA-binding SARP family transcriptional activator